MSEIGRGAAAPPGETTAQRMPSIAEQLAREGLNTPGGVIDCRATLERLRGDWQLFGDLVGFYLADMPPLLETLGRAMNEQDLDRVRRTAHQVKGLIGNFGAAEATVAAGELERLACDGTPADVQRAWERLQSGVAEVSSVLQRFGVASP